MTRQALTYTLGRFALFALSALLLWSGAGVVGLRFNGLPLLLAALLVSSLLSLSLLKRQREAFADSLVVKRDAKTAQIAARRARLEQDRT